MILQRALPYDPAPKRLPGIAPTTMEAWLQVDDAYAAQMAERARLLAERPGDVVWMAPDAHDAALELQEQVLAHLPQGFERVAAGIRCPDGRVWQADMDDPMTALGHLIQEDLCLMISDGSEHVLKAAVLCFPAGWRLMEKANRPLTTIHAPVPDYDPGVAARVQRLFDGVQVGRPLWRYNALWYDDPTLYQPRSSQAPRVRPKPDEAGFFRSERQCVVRLPRTGAVVFSIHTYLLDAQDMHKGAP